MKRPRPKLDQVDAEILTEFLESQGWALIKHGLETMRDLKMRDLVRQHSETETARLRGSIEALERAILMPEELLAEAKRGGKASAQIP